MKTWQVTRDGDVDDVGLTGNTDYIYIYFFLSFFLSVCLSVYLSVYLTICLSFYLSICLSVSLCPEHHPIKRGSLPVQVIIVVYVLVCNKNHRWYLNLVIDFISFIPMCIVDNPLFSDPSVILAIGESLVNDWVPFKDMDYHLRKHPLDVWDMIPSIPRHQSPKRFDWRMLLLGEEQSWLVVLTILKNISQWEGLYIPYMKWKIKFMFQTTNQNLYIDCLFRSVNHPLFPRSIPVHRLLRWAQPNIAGYPLVSSNIWQLKIPRKWSFKSL